jgi:hypothetical protein
VNYGKTLICTTPKERFFIIKPKNDCNASPLNKETYETANQGQTMVSYIVNYPSCHLCSNLVPKIKLLRIELSSG